MNKNTYERRRKKWNKWTWTVFSYEISSDKHSKSIQTTETEWKILSTYETMGRQAEEEKENWTTEGKKTDKIKRRLTTFILANFLQTYCYIENIWEKSNRNGMEKNSTQMQNSSGGRWKGKKTNFFCYIIYILFAVNVGCVFARVGEGSQGNRFTMMHPFWMCLLWNVYCRR